MAYLRIGRASLLIVCVVCSLFVSAWMLPHVGGPGGEHIIQVYVVDADDSGNSWIGSRDAVIEGVNVAIQDANSRTKVKLFGESIPNEIHIANASDLESKVKNSTLERAVVINAHGEVAPLPDMYLSPYVNIEDPVDVSIDPTPVNATWNVTAIVNPMGHSLSGSPYVYWNRIEEPGNVLGLEYMNLVDAEAHEWNASIGRLTYNNTYEIWVTARTTDGLSAAAYVRVNNLGQALEWEKAKGHMHFLINCPYLWVWNGTGLEMRDNLICPLNDSFVDYYKLDEPVVANESGEYCFRLFESETKRDFFDYAGLMAVDHADDVEVGVDSNGTVMSYAVPYVPFSVMSDYGYSVLMFVREEEDDVSYSLVDGHAFDIEFQGLNVSAGAKLIVRARSNSQGSLCLQRLNATGVWESVASLHPRLSWSKHMVNVSACVPDFNGTGQLRLLGVGGCDVDFVGLDISAEANCTVEQGTLVSVLDSRGVNATFGNLQCMDGVCAELRHNYDFDLRFSLSEFNGSGGLKRDFIFVSKAYYLEGEGGEQGRMLSGESMSSGSGLGSYICVDWMDWFDLIEEACRTRGWIWANVAGYDFYYFGNEEFWNFMGPDYDPTHDDQFQPHMEGLKQYLSKDVTCHYNDGHSAGLGFGYTERNGFWDTYPGVDGHRTVGASRPIDKDAPIPWNMFFFKDSVDDSWSTATIAMNSTKFGVACQAGVFVHNGFSKDSDMVGGETSEDDWLKGYVATSLAIEEARSFVSLPELKHWNWLDDEGNSMGNQTVCFGASLRAADRGEYYDPVVGDYYRYVRLLLTTGAHYPRTQGYYLEMYGAFYLSVADIKLCAAPDVSYVIYESKCGCELGEQASIMNDWFWYAVSTTAGFIPQAGIFLGPVLGALPILIASFQPASKNLQGNEAYANGTRINYIEPNPDRNKGTIGYYVEVRFYKGTGGNRIYDFSYGRTSWIGWRGLVDVQYVRAISNATQLSFEVDWST